MSKKPLVRALALATVAAMWFSAHACVQPAVAYAQSEPVASPESSRVPFEGEEQWHAHFNEAKVAFSERRFQDAKASILKAGAIKTTPNIIANLAQVEVQLGEYRAAANHASEALAALGRNPGIEEDLAVAAQHLGRLLIRANVDAATISIDGVPLGVTPMVRPLYADPGQRRIMVSKPGYRTILREVELQLATEVQLEIVLVTETAPPGSSAKNPPNLADATSFDSSDMQGSSRARVAVLAAGGVVAVGGLVAGLYFNAKANSNADKANALNVAVGRDGCSQPGGSFALECEQLLDRRRAQDRNRNWSSVGFVVGGAAVIGTVGYWLWTRNDAKVGASRGTIRGGAGPAGAWIGYQRNF